MRLISSPVGGCGNKLITIECKKVDYFGYKRVVDGDLFFSCFPSINPGQHLFQFFHTRCLNQVGLVVVFVVVSAVRVIYVVSVVVIVCVVDIGSPSSSSLSLRLLQSSFGTAEMVPNIGYTSNGPCFYKDLGTYLEFRGLHVDEWPMPIDGLRCTRFGTILRPYFWNYNHIVRFVCFMCEGCVAWTRSLTKFQSILLSATEAALDELRKGGV